MTLSFRFALVMGLALLATLGLALMLAMTKFDTTLHTITDDRRQTVTARFAGEIESGLDIGLTLTEFNGLRGNIERLMANDDELTGMALVDADGAIKMAVGQGFAAGDRFTLPADRQSRWTTTADDITLTGRLVYTSYGQLRAGVILRFSNSGTLRSATDLGRFLWLVVTLSVSLVMLTLILIGGYAFRPLEALLLQASKRQERPS